MRAPEKPIGLFSFFHELEHHLRYVGRFSITDRVSGLVNGFVEHNLAVASFTIEPGAVYYRARIHDASQSKAFLPDQMGPPQFGKSNGGRINPEGIPCLYLADSPDTALAEVRPWKGASVSVGTFKITKQVQGVNLALSENLKGLKPNTQADKDRYTQALRANFLKNIYFSTPTHSADKHAYLASQYIAEMFRVRGVGAITYKSVLFEGGNNTAMFVLDGASCETVRRYAVDAVEYKTKPVGKA